MGRGFCLKSVKTCTNQKLYVCPIKRMCNFTWVHTIPFWQPDEDLMSGQCCCLQPSVCWPLWSSWVWCTRSVLCLTWKKEWKPVSKPVGNFYHLCCTQNSGMGGPGHPMRSHELVPAHTHSSCWACKKVFFGNQRAKFQHVQHLHVYSGGYLQMKKAVWLFSMACALPWKDPGTASYVDSLRLSGWAFWPDCNRRDDWL